MYSPWRDRLLIDYCQFIIEEALLPRTSGAPFIGEGEKYWSVIDDHDVELMKALWEGPDYLRIPMARRIWGLDIGITREFFYKQAEQVVADCAALAGQTEMLTLDTYAFNRGVWVMVAGQAKRWESVRVLGEYYKLAKEAFLSFTGRRNELYYLAEIIKWEGKEL